MSDRDVAKLIVVTQRDKRHKLDRGLAEMINDGLAMYEQELNVVSVAAGRQRLGAGAVGLGLWGWGCGVLGQAAWEAWRAWEPGPSACLAARRRLLDPRPHPRPPRRTRAAAAAATTTAARRATRTSAPASTAPWASATFTAARSPSPTRAWAAGPSAACWARARPATASAGSWAARRPRAAACTAPRPAATSAGAAAGLAGARGPGRAARCRGPRWRRWRRRQAAGRPMRWPAAGASPHPRRALLTPPPPPPPPPQVVAAGLLAALGRVAGLLCAAAQVPAPQPQPARGERIQADALRKVVQALHRGPRRQGCAARLLTRLLTRLLPGAGRARRLRSLARSTSRRCRTPTARRAAPSSQPPRPAGPGLQPATLPPSHPPTPPLPARPATHPPTHHLPAQALARARR
jgi:hypothetical protein